ncbi:LptF/LptG family permease [Pelagibacteraceae bacterium]|nr:LptF/LptG family permease [Pelagibacteraceae bacterium]MDC0366718.1 LptF/LptG family permease [Pelagibacteraceae bacterium]|tara:strand:- start:2132 stop:3265 length:1134 start_codon:yes stop_codon:yes gene_type:complete
MLTNKIYQNFTKEILKTFLVILFGLSIIAWTVRAVNFLDLIVENGYSILTYFQYSFLNLAAILTKLIPLSFLLSLMIFLVKQIQDNEFIILWTSGVKKLKIVNLLFFVSIFVLLFYIIFSAFVTPYALNKSRNLLNKEGFNSFLPTIRVQQFSDSFTGFTFIVEEKFENEVKNVFMYDKSNALKNLTSNQSETTATTVIAKEGIVKDRKMFLFDGSIITTNRNNGENDIVKFEQINIDLKNLKTGTIKQFKFQETSSINLVNCIINPSAIIINCNENVNSEIITVLNRRFFLPFYIPVVALICSFLLIKTQSKKNYFLNKYSIFVLGFLVLIYSELIIRFTGISKVIGTLFVISPFILIPIIYLFLILKLNRESISR